MNELKQELFKQCLNYVQCRMEAAQQAIEAAQAAARDDTKSSAGDKYETGRAMMQQETNRNMAQLTEANKLKVILNKISPSTILNKADAGSVVVTNHGSFYIAIGAGTLVVDDETYFAVSLNSPIGQKLTGLTDGQTFELNKKAYVVKNVF
jgi:transcription elongation GreA/GreB family factor